MTGSSDELKKIKGKAKASLTLLLVAVISITTATYAWFSLSNSTSVQSMEVRVGASTILKLRTTYSANLDDYKPSLTSDEIDSAMNSAHDYGLEDIRLWPLTSGDGVALYTESGNSVSTDEGVAISKKAYMEFTLWFMSNENMNVYLNGQDSPNSTVGKEDGTKIYSGDDNTAKQESVEEAVRVSFTSYKGGQNGAEDKTVIYEPNKDGDTTLRGNARGDAGGDQVTFDKLGTNAGTTTGNGTAPPVLFKLGRNSPTKVVVRIWIEGEDPQCVNGNGTGSNTSVNIEKALLLARLRFCGADDAGKYIEGSASE